MVDGRGWAESEASFGLSSCVSSSLYDFCTICTLSNDAKAGL